MTNKPGTYIRTDAIKEKNRMAVSGEKHVNFGKKRKRETVEKMKESSKNIDRSFLIGNQYRKGIPHTKETKLKMSESRRGELHPNWKGGISKNPYPIEFNSELKLKIRERDNFTCCLCQRNEREELTEFNRVLCVNHIDFDKKNCSESNLNTLCLRCNVKINREREYWTNHFQTYDE